MSSSCLKIISCGSRDSFDNDEGHVQPSSQGKDKRGWSFRKRPSRHRVLNNTVTSEMPLSGNKATPVSAETDFQYQASSALPEKVPAVVYTEEKSKLSTPVSSKLSETIALSADESIADVKRDEPDASLDVLDADVNPDELNDDSNLDESVVIVIQSAVRTFLAQKVLLESKNIIKLQAAVRGHLVRQHAVGTLRCVQAIIKMQLLVRTRCARILEEESIAVEDHGKGKENAMGKPDVTYTSIEKLLSNRFARRLLDSTPRTKSINIKCDPSKSDSAWKWLERWMTVSPAEDQPPLRTIAQHAKSIEQTATQERAAQERAALLHGVEQIDLVTQEDTVVLHDKKEEAHIIIHEQTSVICDEKEMENVLPQEQMVVPSESNFRSSLDLSSEVSESYEELVTHDEERLGIQSHEPTSELSHNLKRLETHNTMNTKAEHIDLVWEETKELQFPGTGEFDNIVPRETETRSEQSFESQERSAHERSETQGNKLIVGSRQASNPNFLAAQSKFKELSSVANLTKSMMSSTSQTAEDESYVDTVSSFTDQPSRKDFGHVEVLLSSRSKVQFGNSDNLEVQLGCSDTSMIQLGGSECGTELSITSTLDSPEGSDVRTSEFELEGKVLEDMNGHSQSKHSLAEEAKVDPTTINAGIFDSDAFQTERYDTVLGANDDHGASSVTVDSKVEQKHETDVSKLQVDIEPEKRNSISKSSPGASPRSRATVPEPQDTPSSEVSVKLKSTKGEKSGSNHKRKSLSAGKTSPSNPNHGSGGRSSVDQSHKQKKSVKRFNSFGSPKPDHVDQEPRDSSNSSPIPSYMKPTESARAKALLNSSPRFSPDMLEKDFSIKKRHSLPGGNGRHGSPQIKRTLYEVPQTVKGNESQPQKDKKWRR
ncbi:hypothetical protein Leryth_010610 [Lithospermum erythrorhizon]|nr:hypothetical protein Leryth_010610 [Lithospermum erythrorhizon]